jgi:flavodoxin
MKVLSLYHSQTKNTLKVAETIESAAVNAGCEVKTMQTKPGAEPVQLLDYDLIFIGSGVYGWLPGKAMIEWLGERAKESMEEFGGSGLFKPGSPRLAGKYFATYCTFGGSHTGVNEAIPAVRYMGQLFDHLGFTNAAEWYVPGAYHVPKLKHHNTEGRLGDITNRPNEQDLASIAEKVKGLIASLEPSINEVKAAS